MGTGSEGITGPVSLTPILPAAGDGDRKLTAEEEEARRIAEMGKPVLGENRRLEVIIEESYDFKVTLRGPSFLESCLSYFLGEGLVRVNDEGDQGSEAVFLSLHQHHGQQHHLFPSCWELGCRRSRTSERGL